MKSKLTKLFTLLTILTLGITNVWAADQSVTFGTAIGTKGYVYSSSTVANNSILTDKRVYYSSAKNTVSLSSSKIIAYRLSLIFKLSSPANVDAIIGQNKNKPVTYVLYSISDTQYEFIKGMSGVSNDVATAYVALAADDPMKILFKDASISSNDASRQKLLSAVDVADVTTKLYTSDSYATSTSATTTIPIWVAATGDNKDVLPAGNYAIYIDCGSSSGNTLDNLSFTAVSVTKHAVTYDLNGGTGTTPTQADVAEGAKFTLHDGTTGITAPDNKIFDGWNDGTTTYSGGAEYTMGTSDVTLTAQWASAHTVSFVANGGGSSMESVKVKDGSTYTIPACGFTPEDANHTFSHWAISGVAGKTEGDPDETFTMPAGDVTLTAQWTASYTITEGTHTNGSITIDPTSAAEGATITLTATPNANYLFDAWDVYKTGESSTKVAVTNNQFTMPAYPVTVNATFVEDNRPKVLYVTKNDEATTKSSDKLYDALKDDYNIKIVAANSTETLTDYALVVLHESVDGSSYNATAVAAAKTSSVPVLNTKSYFYNNANTNDRWGWGTPNAGTSVKGCTPNTAYCNIADHPIFAGVIDAGFVEITDDAAAKCMQPIGAFTTGLEGYTLATTPNNGEGNGCAIHEIPAGNSVRGGGTGKYLMISVSNAKLNALNANGQKLFQNAVAYLIGSTTWTPIVAPTSPEVTATLSENYTEGNTITLAASATGTSASTTYTWYKGADWATASATTPVQAASTSGATYTKTAAVEDAGTYWCNISNGTGCDVQASVTITVSSASTPTHAISYDEVKGADMSAYPTEYTEGVGVASFEPLADITGWHFVEWSPASIGTDADDDVTITAIWKQVFEVTFNMQDHGDAIDAQNIVDGEKVIAPTAPTATDYDFGGWYKEAGCTNAWDFANDVVTEATVLYAKWTVDPCLSSERKSLSKVVLTAANDGTVSGYNANEYAGEKVIGGLSGTQAAEVDPSHEGTETGYKLSSGGSAIVFATLKKGTFQEGDRVVVTITKKQDAYKVAEVAQPILDIYYGTSKDDATFLATIDDVTAAGSYTYRLTAADITAIGTKTGIGVFRPSSGRTQNPYVYSVEIQGCRSWSIFHTLTFKNIDGTVDVATPALEEGAYASTVAPAAPKIAMKRFLGWSESVGGALVDLTSYTITADATLYAVYEDIVCPTNGTVYKFVIKDELPSENLPTSTDKDMSSYITATGEGYLTYTATANNKATINSDGTIQMKDATAAYLKVELECTLTAGDQIRSNISNNPMRVQVATTFDADDDLILAKNVYNTVDITSAMVGKNVLYIARSTNGNANIADFEIYRPAKYDVSFNMMGHGSAIADLTDVPEGSKITAPTAPTDADYAFAGWYKENTLENEWDFDNDVVNAATTLYAKWLDKSDATLKSLKYGDEDITLVDGIDTYNISLPAFTSAVPALTAVPNNPNATAVPTNAAAFDGEGNATSTVLVTPESGTPQTYTVNFSKGVEVTLQDVTGSITWDFANAVSANVSITNTPQVLANYGGVTNDATFESDKLEASGEKFTAGTKPNLRAKTIHFHTTVPGMLSISYSNTGGTNPARYIYVNGVKYDNDGSASTTPKGIDNKVFVPAGDVYLEMKDGEDAPQNIQVYKIIFNDQANYTRNVTEGRYGTICLPNGGVMTGAELYEVAYYGATSQKIFLDQIPSGEMVAGRPYIFLPNEGASQLGVFYTDAVNADAGSHNGLIGSYTKEPIAANAGNYILLNNQYCPVESTVDPVYVGANKAYIKLGDITPVAPALKPGAKRVGLGVAAPQTPTDIDNLNATDAPVKVMINGQMYIIRGEKMYNANGQLVK